MADFNNPVPVSPLAGAPQPEGGITLTEVPFSGKVNIRGNAADAAFADAAQKAIGVALPTDANTVATGSGNTVYWMGPDEWLVHTPQGAEGKLIDALRAGFSGVHAAVTDVSDYYVVFDLGGPHAREALMRGTPLDVHESAFKAGDCAQTVFVKASILLHCTSDAPSYRVQVRWTYAQYLWNYFVTTAKQWAA